jgi:hypothetical protein
MGQRGGAGRIRRQSASTSIAGIVLHCREQRVGARSGRAYETEEREKHQ